MAPKMNKSDWYDSDSDTLAESLWGKTTKDVSNKHNNKAPDQKIIRYKGYMVSKGLATSGKQPSWSTAEFRDLPFDNAKLKQMVEAYYSRTGKGLAHNYKNLTPSQQRAVNRVVDEQIKKETNSRVEWTLECVRVARIKQHTWSAPEIKSIEVILKSQERATHNNRKANLNQDFLSYGDDDWLDLKVPPKKTKGVANSKAKTAKGAVRAMPGSRKMQNLDFSSDYEDYNLPKDPFMMPLGVGPKPQQNFSKPMNPVGSGLGPSFGPNQGGQPNFNNFGPGPGPHNLPANAPRPMGGPNGPAMNGPPPGAFSNGLAGNLPKAPLPAGMFPDVPMGPSLNAGPPNAGPPNMGPPNAGQAGPRMGPPPNGLPPGAIHINDFPGGARGHGLNGPQTNLPFDRPFVNPANNGFNPARPQPPVNYRSDRLRSDSPEYRSGRGRSRSHHDRYESRSRDHSRNGSRDRSYRRNSYRDHRSRTRSHDRSLPRRRDSTSNRQLRRIQRTMDTFADKLDALDINNASDSSSYHDSVFEHSSAYLSTPGTTPELAPRSLDGGRGRRLYTKASRPHLRRVLIEPAVSRGPGLPRSRRSPAYIDYQPARPPLQRRMTVSGQPTLRPRVHKSYDVDDYPYEAIEGPPRRGSLFESDAWAPHRTREQDWRRGEVMGQSRYYN